MSQDSVIHSMKQNIAITAPDLNGDTRSSRVSSIPTNVLMAAICATGAP